MRKWIVKNIALLSLLLFICSGNTISAKAAMESGTAGAALGKETAEEVRNLRTTPGWREDDDGRWYVYEDGSYPSDAWRKIEDKWCYFNKAGYWVDNNKLEEGTLKGIDVSKWQGEIDWQAVKDFGIQFAFVRAGHGTRELDKYFARNMQGANNAEIPAGVYFYSTAQSEGQAILDAQFVIESMQGYQVSYPVVIDLEDSSQSHLSKAQIGKIAKAFCAEIRKAGYTPMLYCNENWYTNYIDISQIQDVEKWVARYNVEYNESIPRAIWQCSSRGRVDGIKGNVDIDFGYKDFTKIITPRTEPEKNYSFEKGTWILDSRGWWYNYYAGGYARNQWEKIQEKWYYFDEAGYMVTGWKQIGTTWYYMYGNGTMASDTWIDGYYVNKSGAWVIGKKPAGWVQSGSKWWYRNEDGTYPASCWKLIDGSWYYFDASGYMVTGWVYSGGTWYYLKADGAMAADEWIDNGRYYVDSTGKWVPNKKK